MKLQHLLYLAAAAIGISHVQAQEAPPGPTPGPNPEATLQYIHSAWDTLTRSATDCHSLADVKVSASQVLYLPAEMTAPPEVAALEQKCSVKAASLPRRIEKIEADYVGFAVPNLFVIGYGMDFAERYRNLPDICLMPPDQPA